MYEDLQNVLEDVLENENEANKFLEMETMDELYEYFKNKIPNLSVEEFDSFIFDLLEEYAKNAQSAQSLDPSALNKVAGGADAKSRIAAAAMSLLTLFPMAPVGSAHGDAESVTSSSQSIATEGQGKFDKIKNMLLEKFKSAKQTVSNKYKEAKEFVADKYAKTKKWVIENPKLAGGIAFAAVVLAAASTYGVYKHRHPNQPRVVPSQQGSPPPVVPPQGGPPRVVPSQQGSPPPVVPPQGGPPPVVPPQGGPPPVVPPQGGPPPVIPSQQGGPPPVIPSPQGGPPPVAPSPQGGPPPVIPSPQGGPPPVIPSPQGGPPPVVQIGGNRTAGLPHGQSTAPPLNAVSGQSAAPARPGSFVPNFRFNQTQPPAGPTSNLNQSSMGSPTSDAPILRQPDTPPVSNHVAPDAGTSGATRSAQPRIRATAQSPRHRGGASLELRQRADQAMEDLRNAMESDTSQTQGETIPLPTDDHETVMDRLARDTLAAQHQQVIAAAQAQSPQGRYNQLKHPPLAIEWKKDVPPTATRTTPHGSTVTAQNQTRQVHPGTPAASAVGSRTSGDRGTTPSVSSVGQTQGNQSTSKFNMDAPAFVPKSARVTSARQDAAEAVGTQNPTNPGAPPTATQPTGTPDRANKGRGQGEPKQNQRGKNKGQNKGNGRGKGNRQVVTDTSGFTINEPNFGNTGKNGK